MSTRSLLTAAVAVGVHVALLVGLPRARAWATEPPPAPTVEIAIEVTPTEPEVAAAAIVAGATVAERSEGAVTALSHLGTTGTNLPGGDPGGGPIEPAPASSQQGGAQPFGGILVVPGGDRSAIGLGGSGSYRSEAALAGSAGLTAQQRFDRALNAPLIAHDREMGMLQEAPAILALEDATRASGGPLEGRAVFALTFDANGTVTGASVESSSSDRASWEDIAKKAAAALAQKHVRVPNGAKGLALRIEVESKVVLPSGSHSAISGVGLKGGSGANVGLGGNFDVSDIGSKPSRVVGARTIGASNL